MAAKEDLRWALITDCHRGVYFGRIALNAITDDPIFAHDIRHVFRWVASEGIGQLCTDGPGTGSKIGPPVACGLIRDVKNVLLLSAEAVLRLGSQEWDA